MKFSQGTVNFWSLVGNCIFALALSVAVTFFVSKTIGAILISILLFSLFWFLRDIKAKMLQGIPKESQHYPAHLQDYPLLNIDWLNSQTDELKSLGFIDLRDSADENKIVFVLSFSHPQHYCYAEVAYAFTVTGEFASKHVTIFSMLEDNWSLQHFDREVTVNDAIPYGFWYNPKSVRIYSSEISLSELLQQHLALRRKMIENLDIRLLTDVSLENFVSQEQNFLTFQRHSIRRQPLLWSMFKVALFELNPKAQWWGHYKKFKNRSSIAG